MAYEDILVKKTDGECRITINRPDKGNMFCEKTLLELIDVFSSTRSDKETRVIVLTGAGDRFFCIGGEKEEFSGYHYGSALPVVDLYNLIDSSPKPVIAAVNGFAVGGGNVLALVCDFTVASEAAVFRQVGPSMGSYDAGYGTWFLEDAVGRKKAKEIWMLNRKIPAAEALRLGLVNEVVPPSELAATVQRWCDELKARGPQALAALKASFYARHNGVLGLSRLAHDQLAQYYYRTEEAKEMGKSFAEKRPPDLSKFYK